MNKKHWTKKAKIGLSVPLITLGVGGGTVGGLAIAGYVFHVGPLAPSKIDIASIFSQCSGWSTIAPSNPAIVDGSTFPTTGALISTTLFQSKPNNNDIKSYLISQLPSEYKDLVDEINMSTIGVDNGNGYYHVEINMKNNSRTYQGSIWAYFHWNPTGTATLASDFTNTAITYAYANSPIANKSTINQLDLLQSLEVQNVNLNIDAVVFQYKNTDNTWLNWNWATLPTFGATANSFDTTYLPMLWDKIDDLYANIRIAPDPKNAYYLDSTAVDFTLNLYRPEITNETNWTTKKTTMQSETNSYDVLPTHATIVQTTFDENFESEVWYSDKLNGNTISTDAYADTWWFELNPSGYSGHNTPTAIFNIEGNPYYNTHIDALGSATTVTYQWDYGVRIKADISNIIVDGQGSTITNMPNAFFAQLNNDTVRDNTKSALIKINPALETSISWNQIVITLTSTTANGGSVTLAPIDGSNLYQGTLTINYTLKTV